MCCVTMEKRRAKKHPQMSLNGYCATAANNRRKAFEINTMRNAEGGDDMGAQKGRWRKSAQMGGHWVVNYVVLVRNMAQMTPVWVLHAARDKSSRALIEIERRFGEDMMGG